MAFCQLWLTCANTDEANKIAQHLLSKRLVACAKQLPVVADYWWQENIEHASEVLLIMETRLDFFDIIENEISGIHSYETFVLQAINLERISSKAQNWLSQEASGVET